MGANTKPNPGKKKHQNSYNISLILISRYLENMEEINSKGGKPRRIEYNNAWNQIFYSGYTNLRY